MLVRDGQAVVTILHPDSAAGRQAAATVAAAIADRTGVTPTIRVGTEADRIPDRPTILLGNVDNNPAMLLLYARYMTPADSVCPGAGGALVHTVCDPFGKGANVIVAAASDDAGLAKAADVLAERIAEQAKARSLVLPRLFEKHYGESFLKRFGWADDAPAAEPSGTGIEARPGRPRPAARHTSIAGVLASVAESLHAHRAQRGSGAVRRSSGTSTPRAPWPTRASTAGPGDSTATSPRPRSSPAGISSKTIRR